MAGDAKPRPHTLDSPSSHGGLLNVLGWLFVIIAFLILVTRAGKRWTISKRFGFDDALIAIAMIIAVIQTACLSLAVGHGYGVSKQSDGEKHQSQQKLIYAFNILFFLSQYFSMGSVVIQIRNLTPVRWHNITCNVLFYSMGLWIMITTLGLIFQCRPPTMWLSDDNTCMQRVAFYTFIEAVNVAFEGLLVIVPILVTWNLRIKFGRKLMVLIGFCGRSLVIAALVTQLVILYHNTDPSFPFSAWGFALTTSLAQSLSIITACIPYLRPFLKGIDSSIIDNDGLRRRGIPYGSDIPTAESYMNHQYMPRSQNGAKPSTEPRPLEDTYGNIAFIVSHPDSRSVRGLRSMEGSKKHMIRQTRTVTVQSSDRGPSQELQTV